MGGEELRLLFLDTVSLEHESVVRGGALVTDSSTEPVEFRCTSPVRPTLLQKTLWGRRLSGHIAVRLVGKPLYHALTNKVSLVLVRKPEFLELRELLDVPLVQVLRNEELTQVSPLAADLGKDDVLECAGGKFEPVVLKVHRDWKDDFQAARAVLSEVFRSYNPLEPFDRVATALKLVHKQETKTKK